MTSSCSEAPGTWSSLTYNRYLPKVSRVTAVSFSGDDPNAQEGHWHCPLAAAVDAESRLWFSACRKMLPLRRGDLKHTDIEVWCHGLWVPWMAARPLRRWGFQTAGFCPPEPQLLRSAPDGTPWHPPIMLSHVRLFATPWIVASQALRFMGISRQEYLEWSAIFSSRGSSNPEIEP